MKSMLMGMVGMVAALSLLVLPAVTLAAPGEELDLDEELEAIEVEELEDVAVDVDEEGAELDADIKFELGDLDIRVKVDGSIGDLLGSFAGLGHPAFPMDSEMML